MQTPLAPLAIQMPEYQRRANSVRDLLGGFSDNERLFKSIEDLPQLGIYERFGKERALCLSYIESEAHRLYEDVGVYLRRFNDNALQDPAEETPQVLTEEVPQIFTEEASQALPKEVSHVLTDEEIRQQFAPKMKLLIDWIYLHGSFFDQSRMMARAISPSSRSRKIVYNKYLSKTENGRAPNGQDITRYEADSAAESFAALAHEKLHPIEQLLAFHCMAPLLDYVIWPIEDYLCNIFKNGNHKPKNRDRTLAAEYISAIAKPVISTTAILSIAAAVSVLNGTNSPKLSIIVMTLFAEAFALSASFFGQEYMAMLHLITAYFQAMIFFVGVNK